ncbi:cellulose synthase operon protein YhjQ/BcsQ [Rhodovibrionaceae bacterium A322]
MSLNVVRDYSQDALDGKRRVAAFVSDSQSQEVLKLALTRLDLGNELVQKGTIRDAIEHFSKHPSPQLIIADVSNLEMPVSLINELANVCEPGTHVVIVGDQESVGLFRELVQLGVTDYLVKPLPEDLLLRALHRAVGDEAARRRSQRAGRVISVYGTVGGVGATSLTAALGHQLSGRLNRRVALIDPDLHNGDLALHLNVNPGNGLLEALSDVQRLDTVFLERATAKRGERLSLLASEQDLKEPAHFASDAMEKITDLLANQHHFVAVDVPRSPSDQAISIMKDSDLRLLVLEPSLASLRMAARCLRALGRDLDGRRNLLILNHPRHGNKTVMSRAKIEEVLARSIDFVVPYAKELPLAADYGDPEETPGAAFRQAVSSLASELVGESPERASGWRRWLRRG